MAKPKAAPIRDGKHLHHSRERTIKLIQANCDMPPNKLSHSEGTAVPDIMDEWIIFDENQRELSRQSGKKSSRRLRGIEAAISEAADTTGRRTPKPIWEWLKKNATDRCPLKVMDEFDSGYEIYVDGEEIVQRSHEIDKEGRETERMIDKVQKRENFNGKVTRLLKNHS